MFNADCVPSHPFSGTCPDTGFAQTEELRMSEKPARHSSPIRSIPGCLSCVTEFRAGGFLPCSQAADWQRDVNVTASPQQPSCSNFTIPPCSYINFLAPLPLYSSSFPSTLALQTNVLCPSHLRSLLWRFPPIVHKLEAEFSQYSYYLLWHQFNRKVLKLHP